MFVLQFSFVLHLPHSTNEGIVDCLYYSSVLHYIVFVLQFSFVLHLPHSTNEGIVFVLQLSFVIHCVCIAIQFCITFASFHPLMRALYLYYSAVLLYIVFILQFSCVLHLPHSTIEGIVFVLQCSFALHCVCITIQFCITLASFH